MQFAMSYEIPSSVTTQDTMPTTLDELIKFRSIYRPDQSGKMVASCRQISTILICALKRELVRPIETQDPRFIVEVLKDLTKFRHPDSLPVLEKVARQHTVREVCELARAIVYQTKSSLETLWDQTILDPEATVEKRVATLKAARNLPMMPKQLAKVIFSECKALSLRSGYEEIACELTEYLQHSEETVRLGACWVIVKDWAMSEQKLLRDAVFVLADLAVNSNELGTSNDAFQLLKQVRTLSPFADQMVKHAEVEANARFVQLNMARPARIRTACVTPILARVESAAPATKVEVTINCAVKRNEIADARLAATITPAKVSPIALSQTSFFQRYSA